MPMLAFMPWCRIDKTYDVGNVRILPFGPNAPIANLGGPGQTDANKILATYRTIEGAPVDRAALVHYVDKSPLDDLSDEETTALHELVSLACFCGLARREYFNPIGSYCNSDCFAVYCQKFDMADRTAIATRRRDGQTLSSWRIDQIAITVPVHCHTVREVELDEDLLKALVQHRAKSQDDEWPKWQNALACSNQANTDGENILYQVEWVLLCSAFEHILGARAEARDVAERFCKAMDPRESLLVADANRRSDNWKDGKQCLRYEWM